MGNSRKCSPILVENIVYGNETGENNLFAGRVQAITVKPANGQPLVGISTLADSYLVNPPSNQPSRDVWGANFVASAGGSGHGAGNRPDNIVGIEVDVNVSATYDGYSIAPPGSPNSKGYIGYWAQSGGTGLGNAAFYSSTYQGGWQYGVFTGSGYYQYAAWFYNSYSSARGRGVRIQTVYGGSGESVGEGSVLECVLGGNANLPPDPSNSNTTAGNETGKVLFKVDSNTGDGPGSAVRIRVNGQLRTIEIGASDSGGTGYRMLRVLN